MQSHFPRKVTRQTKQFKNFLLIMDFRTNFFQVPQMHKQNLLQHGIFGSWIQNAKLAKIDKCNTIFLGKQGNTWHSLKTSSLHCSCLQICFEVCQKQKLNLLGHGILVQTLISQIWSTYTKPFFWGSHTNFGTVQKLSSYIGFCYKFVLKSIKSLNRIFWAMKYWFNASYRHFSNLTRQKK